MPYEDILDEIGGWGRYQRIVCLLLAISAIPNGYFTMMPVFTNKTPEHRCRIPEIDDSPQNNMSEPQYNAVGIEMYIPWDAVNNRYERCERFTNLTTNSSISNTTGCNFGYVYNGRPGGVTAVTEWDLVCNKSNVRPLITSIYMAGVLFGSLLSGAITDRLGRWPVLIAATYLQFLFMGLNIFDTSPGMLAALMFLSGGCSLINFVAAVALATELVDAERRAFVETAMMLGFSFGYILLPLAAYFILLWKWLFVIVGLCGVLFIPYWWLIPESPRWLIINGKFSKARDILRKIAKKNRTKLNADSVITDESFKLIVDESKERELSKSTNCLSKIPYVKLFTKPGMLVKTLCSCYSWFVISLIYYSMNLNTGNLGGDDFINCFISAALEILAYSSVYLLLRNRGRRFVMVAYFGISALSCLITPLINRVSVVGGIASAMTGKFFVTCLFSLVYLYTCELFPTEGRNQALGLCSTFARVGSIFSPYIVYLEETGSPDLPYFIIGSLAIAAGFTNMILPETKGKALPDTYEDAQLLRRNYRLLMCKATKKPIDDEPADKVCLS